MQVILGETNIISYINTINANKPPASTLLNSTWNRYQPEKKPVGPIKVPRRFKSDIDLSKMLAG